MIPCDVKPWISSMNRTLPLIALSLVMAQARLSAQDDSSGGGAYGSRGCSGNYSCGASPCCRRQHLLF